MGWVTEYKSSLKLREVEEILDLWFYRPLAFLIVKIVYYTRVTPNHLTLAAIFVGVAGGVAYSFGTPAGFTLGALLYITSNIFDCSDGQLARLKHNGTPVGRVIDGVADLTVMMAVFLGIGIGFARHQEAPLYWWLLLLACGVSCGIQSTLVDFYRNRFLDFYTQRKSDFEENLSVYRKAYIVAKHGKGQWLEMIILYIYLLFSAAQRTLVARRKSSRPFAADPGEYYRKNRLIIRFWLLIGPTTQITNLVVFSLLQRIDLFIWTGLIAFNGLAVILWIIQQVINKNPQNTIGMKSVILAAGIASRLRPLTNDTPKCLLRAGQKPILEQAIENLLANGLTDIIIVTGYLAGQIRDYLDRRFPELGIQLIHNDRYASTNNIYSLGLVADAVKGHPMLMMDSDIVFDQRILGRLLMSGHENCLALKRHAVQDEEIKVRVDNLGRVREISKEVRPADALGESVGIELFTGRMKEELFRVIDRKVRLDGEYSQFYETAFEELINAGHDLYTVDVTDCFCMEIDTPEDLRLAGELIGQIRINSMKNVE